MRQIKLSMKFVKAVVYVLTPVWAAVCQADNWDLQSPDGNLLVSVQQERVEDVTVLNYRVFLGGDELISSSPMGISSVAAGSNDFNDLSFVSKQVNRIAETYSMPVGKKSLIENKANELILSFENHAGEDLKLHLRAYNEGVAYRYQIEKDAPFVIGQEFSAFTVPSGSVGWIQDYHESYELYYIKRTLTEVEALPPLTPAQQLHRKKWGAQRGYGFPLLLNTPSKKWIYITEAAVYGDYAGGRVQGDPEDARTLRVVLESEVRSDAGILTTPWRLVMVSDDLKSIVESDLVTSLNPPSKIVDASWIDPGVSAFPWLTDHEVNGKPERLKEFVDMAAEMGWKWIEFDNAIAFGEDTSTKTEFGKWMSIPWIPEFVAYANSKGIKVAGWDVWNNLNTPKKRETILGYFSEHGFSGIKVDFLNSDSQARFQFRDDIIQACAERELMISFHGATLPRGQQRTWPHIATWEGVRAEEHYTFRSGQPTPRHNVSLCFTRNVVGSMDFTPASFSLKGVKGFERTTTDAHQMALTVLFESAWQNVGAAPEGLNGTKAKGFMKNLPAAWDDIHFIEGHPDTHCVMARRKGTDWYVAGINTETPRELMIGLDFLEEGTYDVVVYTDNSEGEVITTHQQINRRNGLEVKMMKNGGFGVKFSALNR